jgi:hypothetical protein
MNRAGRDGVTVCLKKAPALSRSSETTLLAMVENQQWWWLAAGRTSSSLDGGVRMFP